MDFIQNAEPIVWVQETLGPGYEGLFHVLGIFGTSWGLLLAVAVGFWFFGRRVLYGLLTVAVAEGLARSLLSSGLDVPRPDDPSIVKYEQVTSSASFPSGHVSTAAAVWVYLGRVTRVPTVFALLVVFAVALGRMYLGVHYLADVVAGALLGIVIALAWPKLVERLARPAARVGFRVWAGLAAVALVAVVAALVLLSPDSPYLWRWGGFAGAVAVALPLEWRFVRYHPPEGLGPRLRCALLGALGLAPGVFVHLSGDQRSHAFEAGFLFFTTLWVLLLAPTLFVRWGWSAEGQFERRDPGRHAARVTGLLVAVVLGVFAYGSLVEPRMLLDVREEAVSLPDLPQVWRGARVQLRAVTAAPPAAAPAETTMTRSVHQAPVEPQSAAVRAPCSSSLSARAPRVSASAATCLRRRAAADSTRSATRSASVRERSVRATTTLMTSSRSTSPARRSMRSMTPAATASMSNVSCITRSAAVSPMAARESGARAGSPVSRRISRTSSSRAAKSMEPAAPPA